MSTRLPKGLKRELEAIETLPREALLEDWQKNHGAQAPKGIKQPMLVRSASYHLQARHMGGLKSQTRKALLSIAAGKAVQPKPAAPELKPGMRLLREWHGNTHQVQVLEKGFEWQGQQYTSLSAIAQAITGAKWSGPRFFGL